MPNAQRLAAVIVVTALAKEALAAALGARGSSRLVRRERLAPASEALEVPEDLEEPVTPAAPTASRVLAPDAEGHAHGTLGWLVGGHRLRERREIGHRHEVGTPAGGAAAGSAIGSVAAAGAWSLLAADSDVVGQRREAQANDCDPSSGQEKYRDCLEMAALSCDGGVCRCAAPTYWRFQQRIVLHVKQSVRRALKPLVKLSNKLLGEATSESHAQAVLLEMSFERQGQGQKERLITRLVMSFLSWVFGLPPLCFLLCLMHKRFSVVFKKRAKRIADRAAYGGEVVRTDNDNIDAQKDLTVDEKNRKDIGGLLSENETDRLGGIEKYVLSKITCTTQFMWILLCTLSFGLYYASMDEPVTSSMVILGKTGRLLVLNIIPQVDAKEARRIFRRMGLILQVVVVLSLVFFTCAEAVGLRKLSVGQPLTALESKCVGNVNRNTFGMLAVAWICMYFYLKALLRPWGSRYDRNFYECQDACVGQYMRHGSRGFCPCLGQRIRRGGMRLFFGPYPDKGLFRKMCEGLDSSQNLVPLIRLPKGMDGGIPSYMGGDDGDDEDGSRLRFIVTMINTIIIGVAFMCFYIRMKDLTYNLANCPNAALLTQCVAETIAPDKNSCVVIRSQWFMHYLMEAVQLTEVQRREIMFGMNPPTLAQVGHFFGLTLLSEIRHKVTSFAERACMENRLTSFEEPLSWHEGIAFNSFDYWNAKAHFQFLNALGMKDNGVYWDKDTNICNYCEFMMLNLYITNVENAMEIIEMMAFLVQAYLAYLLYRLFLPTLEGSAMVDMKFECNTAIEESSKVEDVEKNCLDLIGSCFFYRYKYLGVPPHLRTYEQQLGREQQSDKMLTQGLPDPWKLDELDDEKSKEDGSRNTRKAPKDKLTKKEPRNISWMDYNICDLDDPRMMIVNKQCLGVMEGEEVVAAWSEAPNLSTEQHLCIGVSILLMAALPLWLLVQSKEPLCGIELVILLLGLVKGYDYFVVRRRPQAGFVLTTRRIYQITRSPAFNDLFGKTETLICMDVVVHNSELTLSTMTMEPFVPWSRKLYCWINRIRPYRRGSVICQCSAGIFRIDRTLGDTTDLCNSISAIAMTRQSRCVTPELGRQLIEDEARLSEELTQTYPGMKGDQNELIDPVGACMCCPTDTPDYFPDTGQERVSDFLERYCKLQMNEEKVYQRKLAIRPASCGELWCGRGCQCEFSLCCCCVLEEVAQRIAFSNHRILIEHAAWQRYCRCCRFCKKEPPIRATYVAHCRAEAYLVEMPIRPVGLWNLRKDLCIKLLASGSRDFYCGLMLHQRPYLMMKGKEQAEVEKPWLPSIKRLYDAVKETADMQFLNTADVDEKSDSEEDSEGRISMLSGGNMSDTDSG